MILAIFDLQVAMILPAKLANYSFQEKKCKTDFQDLGLQSGVILAIFDLYAALMLPTMFQVNWPLGSGEEALNRFQDGHHGCHVGFPTGTILAIFLSTSCSQYFLLTGLSI